jgi:hypothetical protein
LTVASISVTTPTSYLNVKILPDNAPTPEALRDLQEQVQDVFARHGITAYIHAHQLVKAA